MRIKDGTGAGKEQTGPFMKGSPVIEVEVIVGD